MAIDSACAQATVLDGAVCYNEPCLDPQEQMALLVYAKALLLANMTGGTDYTSTLTTTLLVDAAQQNIPVDPATLQAVRIFQAFRDAAVAGASVPTTTNAKLDAAKCLICADPVQLTRALLLLECEIENIGAAV